MIEGFKGQKPCAFGCQSLRSGAGAGRSEKMGRGKTWRQFYRLQRVSLTTSNLEISEQSYDGNMQRSVSALTFRLY